MEELSRRLHRSKAVMDRPSLDERTLIQLHKTTHERTNTDNAHFSHQLAETVKQTDGPVILDLFSCRVLPEENGIRLVDQVEAMEIQSKEQEKRP
jgi:hypothetical protein